MAASPNTAPFAESRPSNPRCRSPPQILLLNFGGSNGLPFPLKESSGNNRCSCNNTGHEAADVYKTEALEHAWEPKWPQPSPGGADKVEEHTNTGSVLLVDIHSI